MSGTPPRRASSPASWSRAAHVAATGAEQLIKNHTLIASARFSIS